MLSASGTLQVPRREQPVDTFNMLQANFGQIGGKVSTDNQMSGSLNEGMCSNSRLRADRAKHSGKIGEWWTLGGEQWERKIGVETDWP